MHIGLQTLAPQSPTPIMTQLTVYGAKHRRNRPCRSIVESLWQFKRRHHPADGSAKKRLLEEGAKSNPADSTPSSLIS
jgi:hypothetical protein